jgi:hypothetical protein
MAEWVENTEEQLYTFDLVDSDSVPGYKRVIGYVVCVAINRWRAYDRNPYGGGFQYLETAERMQEAQRLVEDAVGVSTNPCNEIDLSLYEMPAPQLEARPGAAKSLYVEYVASHNTDEVDH